jgi:hypothetical protein
VEELHVAERCVRHAAGGVNGGVDIGQSDSSLDLINQFWSQLFISQLFMHNQEVDIDRLNFLSINFHNNWNTTNKSK